MRSPRSTIASKPPPGTTSTPCGPTATAASSTSSTPNWWTGTGNRQRTQTGVIFHLRLLNRLSSGEFDVDAALFTRIDRTVDQSEEAADARDAAARAVFAGLEPIEAAAASTAPDAQHHIFRIDGAAYAGPATEKNESDRIEWISSQRCAAG